MVIIDIRCSFCMNVPCHTTLLSLQPPLRPEGLAIFSRDAAQRRLFDLKLRLKVYCICHQRSAAVPAMSNCSVVWCKEVFAVPLLRSASRGIILANQTTTIFIHTSIAYLPSKSAYSWHWFVAKNRLRNNVRAHTSILHICDSKSEISFTNVTHLLLTRSFLCEHTWCPQCPQRSQRSVEIEHFA